MGFSPTIAACSLVLLSLLAAPVSGVSGPATDDSPYLGRTIRRIDYEAGAPLDRSHYDPYIGLAVGDTLTRAGVKNALQKLYDMGRFSSISLEAFPDDQGVALRFRLTLNYYFNDFDLVGEIDLGARRAWDLIALPVGERFSEERLEDARTAVIKYLRDRGFFGAEVEVATAGHETTRQIDTTFTVRTGELARIGSIEVRGVPPEEADRIKDRLKIEKGSTYARERVRRRLENLKQYFLDQGYLEATATFTSEEYRSRDNTIDLVIDVANYGRVRVEVEGFKAPSQQLRRLLPVLSGGGVNEDLLEEGARNLVEYLEGRGFPYADVEISEERDRTGVRTIRYKVETGSKITVTDVTFEGNSAFTSEQLLQVVQIQPSRFLQRSVYSVQKLDEDVEALRALYQSEGYLDARIIPLPETVRGADRIRIRFSCEEGTRARTGDVSFTGNRSIETGQLERRISLRRGGHYSPIVVEQSRQTILAAYNDAGFLQPRVVYQTNQAGEGNSHQVEFQIEEGPRSFIDDVLILGNQRTRRSVIERRIYVREAEPLSLGKMLETQQALYNTGLFDRVRVSPQNPESTAPHQDVVVRLEEARQLIVGYGLGYQENEGPRGTLELTHLNVLGSGRRGDIRLRGSGIEQSAILSFQQPRILPVQLDSYFTFSARKKREVSFDARRLNLSSQFGHPVSDHSWALLRYTFSNVFVSNLKVSGSELEREDVPRNLSTISAIYVNDTRDNYLDAEKGFFTSTDVSLTAKALGSNNNFFSVFTQTHYYRRLPASLLLASSLRFGAARPFGGDRDLPLSEKFFAGGGSSLRGFSTDRAGPLDPVTNRPLGGNALLVLNAEIKLPILRFLQLAGFYDTGNVFKSLGDLRLTDFSHTVGLGLRIRTPFGPIRVDYGFNLNLPERLSGIKDFRPRQLFVTIGPPF